MAWVAQLLRPTRAVHDQTPLPIAGAPAVLGLTITEPVPITPALRTMAFRGQMWVQSEPANGAGIVTFTREVSVDGRAVSSELRVHERDLVARGDVFFLEGRD